MSIISSNNPRYQILIIKGALLNNNLNYPPRIVFLICVAPVCISHVDDFEIITSTSKLSQWTKYGGPKVFLWQGICSIGFLDRSILLSSYRRMFVSISDFCSLLSASQALSPRTILHHAFSITVLNCQHPYLCHSQHVRYPFLPKSRHRLRQRL